LNLLFYVPQMAAYGGMERHVCVLAQEAAARGHHVRLLTTSDSLNAASRAALVTAGVDFRELSRPRGEAGKFQKYLWLWRETRRARATPWDIIYTNGQSALAAIVWGAARRQPPTRIIHHHHTAADAGEQATWAAGFRRVLARAPEIVACSEATRTGIELALHRQGIRFLPYFTACPVRREEVVEPGPAGDRVLNIGFLGRLVSTKGIDIVCTLSRRPELAGVLWHIHGEGPEYPETYFREFPNIRYHGPYRDLARHGEILRSLDAVALFSIHNEGMPLSLIETMSAGLPWIATDRGGTRELAAAAGNCVVLDHPCTAENALPRVLEFVRRLRAGETSRHAQRAVYDARFAPPVVSRLWFRYLENTHPVAPRRARPCLRSPVWQPLRRLARHLEKWIRFLRVCALAAPRELAWSRTRLHLPRNQLFPLQTSQADGITLRFVDPEEPFERPLPSLPGESVCHPVFLQHRRGTHPASFVAELRDGRVWSCYNSAVLTADGRLIPEISKDMWGPAIHKIYTRARLPPPRRLPGRTLSLITPEAAGNYHHWMIDLLPRVHLVQRAGWDLRSFDHILIKDRGLPFQRETLLRLGLDETRFIRVGEQDHFQADSLIVPSLRLNNTLVRPADLEFVRRLFLPEKPAFPRRRLYLSRRDAAYRHVLQEPALLALLRRHGFEEVALSDLTVAEQAALLAEAEAVVAPNGSAMANLVFAPPSCRVIELFAPGWVVVYSWMLSAHFRSDYTAIIGRGARPSPRRAPSGIADDIDVDLSVVEKALATLP
jgi:capsular polysaccharide biosynthesis protein/glycosyltransferase involved in cell wall biosynthesis